MAFSLACLGITIFFFIKLLFDLKIAKRRQSRKRKEETKQRKEGRYENKKSDCIDLIDISRRADRGQRGAVSRKHKESR